MEVDWSQGQRMFAVDVDRMCPVRVCPLNGFQWIGWLSPELRYTTMGARFSQNLIRVIFQIFSDILSDQIVVIVISHEVRTRCISEVDNTSCIGHVQCSSFSIRVAEVVWRNWCFVDRDI